MKDSFRTATIEDLRADPETEVSPIQRLALAERAVEDLMLAIGVPFTDSTEETPKRVAKMYLNELCKGLTYDPREDLSRTFDESHDEVVIVRDISFHSLCEHHLLPFYGKAHIGYLPGDKIVGLSKLARVVNGYAAQPSVQERLSTQVADSLMTHLGARGCMIVIEAAHMCMSIRGVQSPGTFTTTSVVRGLFKDKPPLRDEFLRLIARNPH